MSQIDVLSAGQLVGIWRTGDLIRRTSRHCLHLAQPADSRGSNRWPYVIRSGREESRGETERYLAAADAVRHPGLISVIDGSADAATPYIVMPKMTTDQSGAVGRHLAVILWAARQVAETLAHLHESGWVHGDVRPGHVVGNRMGHTMLIDLGFATPIHSMGRRPHPTSDPYSSPESRRADHAAIPAMDVYSFGQTLATWLEQSSESRADLRDLDSIVARMIDPQPNRRPAAGEMVDELASMEFSVLSRTIAPVRRAA